MLHLHEMYAHINTKVYLTDSCKETRVDWRIDKLLKKQTFGHLCLNFADAFYMILGCLVVGLFSSGGEKCGRCPLWPLAQQAVTAGNQSRQRGTVPTRSTSGHQGGVRHYADTWGRTVRQEHHPEVTRSLSFHCEPLHPTAVARTFCCLIWHLFTPVLLLLYACRSAQKESTKKANIKRENKAYSYKEQIIELELQEV